MKFSIATLLALSTVVSANLDGTKKRRALGGMKKKASAKSGKGKGKSVPDLVDTSAEATALHMSGACGSIPDNDWVDACVQTGGVPTRLKFGQMMRTASLISCCPAEAFDVASIVAYGQTFPRGSGPLCTDGTQSAPNAGVVINDQVWCLPPSVAQV